MAPECRKTRLRASILQKMFSGGACPQTPLAWAAYAAAAYGSHVGFAHKLGNPLPQILDPPLCVCGQVSKDDWILRELDPPRSNNPRLSGPHPGQMDPLTGLSHGRARSCRYRYLVWGTSPLSEEAVTPRKLEIA